MQVARCGFYNVRFRQELLQLLGGPRLGVVASPLLLHDALRLRLQSIKWGAHNFENFGGS